MSRVKLRVEAFGMWMRKDAGVLELSESLESKRRRNCEVGRYSTLFNKSKSNMGTVDFML